MEPEYASPEGQVRLLIADVDHENPILTDLQVAGLLHYTDGNVDRAAARGLRLIATSETLLSKKITTQDLSTDGPAVAAELRAQAAELDAKADEADAKAGTDAYAAFIPNPGGCWPHGIEAEEAHW